MIKELPIKLFVERDGELEFYQDHLVSDFGGCTPNIGDEIPNTINWIGGSEDAIRHGFWVVKRRVFIKASLIALVCSYRQAISSDYELF